MGSLWFGGGGVNQTNVFLFIESIPYANTPAAYQRSFMRVRASVVQM
jgi:hypothetical protein